MYKVVKKLIDEELVGVDVYTKDGKIWFIFTNEKKWVLEIHKNGNLYYYFPFFKNLFSYLSLNVTENQHYITKWVEDTVQNGVKRARPKLTTNLQYFEDTIQNGVKHTYADDWMILTDRVEDTIQNGLKLN